MSQDPQQRPRLTPPPATSSPTKRRPLRWFSPIPVAMLLNPAISGDAIRLFGILLHHEGAEGCFPRQDTLSAEIGKSIDTVQRLLDELRRCGFLEVERRGRRNNYRLAPEYTAPVRPNTFEASGELEVENAAPVRPIPRRALGRREKSGMDVEPQLSLEEAPGGDEHTAPVRSLREDREPDPTARVRSIDAARVRREAAKTPHECGLEAKKNQALSKTSSSKNDAAADLARAEEGRRLQLESELRGIPGITPLIAATVALNLIDEDPRDIVEAAKLLVKRRRFREGRVPNPSGYLREVVRSQVRLERLRAEHEQQKHETHAVIQEGQARFEAVFPTLQPETQALIRQAAYAICSNEQSPAWPIAMQLALRHYLSKNPQLPTCEG